MSESESRKDGASKEPASGQSLRVIRDSIARAATGLKEEGRHNLADNSLFEGLVQRRKIEQDGIGADEKRRDKEKGREPRVNDKTLAELSSNKGRDFER